MSQFSTALEDNLVNGTLRGISYTSESDIYIALFTADPTDAGTAANEVSTSDPSWTTYARQDAADGGAIASGWVAPTSGVTSNAKVITFPSQDGVSDVIVTHIGIYGAITAGNFLYHAPLTSSKTLQQGDVLSFAIGAITITLD